MLGGRLSFRLPDDEAKGVRESDVKGNRREDKFCSGRLCVLCVVYSVGCVLFRTFPTSTIYAASGA